jgi:hypothetical protein
MTPVDPVAAVRSALWRWVEGVQGLAQRGTALADQLLEFVSVRSSERAALTASLSSGEPPADVEDAKFHLGMHRRVRPDRDAGALPRDYGRDRLVLLPRDPWTLFAYWEITPTTRTAALGGLGGNAAGGREVLRISDVTFVTPAGDHACLTFDLEPPAEATRTYVHGCRPGASYRVELGLRTPANRFIPMARSNTVTLPPAAPSTDTTVRWAGPPPTARPLPAANGTWPPSR